MLLMMRFFVSLPAETSTHRSLGSDDAQNASRSELTDKKEDQGSQGPVYQLQHQFERATTLSCAK